MLTRSSTFWAPTARPNRIHPQRLPIFREPFCGESPLTMRAAGRPANALWTLNSRPTSFGPLEWDCSDKLCFSEAIPSPGGEGGRAPARSEEVLTISPKCCSGMIAVPPTSVSPSAIHLPQRGRLWCDKFPLSESSPKTIPPLHTSYSPLLPAFFWNPSAVVANRVGLWYDRQL